MAGPPVIFVDTNTIWHRRFAEALSEVCPTIALEPRGGFGRIGKSSSRVDGALETVSVLLPPGWASKTAFVGQRLLARHVLNAAGKFARTPVVILTSPKYSPLAFLLHGRLPLVYYCADDYTQYEGWGGAEVARAEEAIVQRVERAIFVSSALERRATQLYGIDRARCIVSPNATEPRFAHRGRADAQPLAGWERPIVGVMGVLSRRIDVDLLWRAAEATGVGTLAIIGSPQLEGATRRLEAHPRVAFTGAVPHSIVHEYSAALDFALIPYAPMPLNFSCSPMRLYDHLAAGVPIFATDACDQINEMQAEDLLVSPPGELPSRLESALSGFGAGRSARAAEAKPSIFWSHRAQAVASSLDSI